MVLIFYSILLKFLMCLYCQKIINHFFFYNCFPFDFWSNEPCIAMILKICQDGRDEKQIERLEIRTNDEIRTSC